MWVDRNKKGLQIILCIILIFSFLGESFLFAEHSSVIFKKHISPIGLSNIEIEDNVIEWNNNETYMDYFGESELTKIEKEIPKEIKLIDDKWNQSIALSHYIRNLSNPSTEISDMNLWNSPYNMLILMNEGKGGTCDVYATVYVAGAQSIGIPARVVQLIRSGNMYDTHVIAEVWNDDYEKWVVIDPTFDTYYEINGTPASAVDVKLAFENNYYTNKSEWYSYIIPSDRSKLEQYYIFQYLLYEEVLLRYPAKETWEKVPPVRMFRNPDYLYFTSEDHHFRLQNFIGSLFDIIFPAFFTFAFISLVYLNLRRD